MPSKFGHKYLPVALFILGGLIYAIGAATRAGVPGMVFDAICRELQFSAAQTSMISSSGVIGCMVFISFTGLLTDRFGWWKMLLIGALLQVSGEYMIYTGHLPWHLYFGAFINGGGRTIGYLSLLKFIDVQFPRKLFSVLIGVFYIFSYGGTLAGTFVFTHATLQLPWQAILQYCNHFTIFAAIAILVITIIRPEKSWPSSANITSENPPNYQDFLGQLRRRNAIFITICTASGIAIYWAIMAGAGKKYLQDICGLSGDVLSLMNIIVMLEMVFAGSISYLLHNRRKPFQILSAGLILVSILLLLAGIQLDREMSPAIGILGFICLGLGYGCTGVNLTAVREFLPEKFAASGIGFANFCANIGIIILTQFGGFVFDYFSTPAEPTAAIPYSILLIAYLIIAVPAFICALLINK